MASEARMGEAVPRWRRAPETAQDPRGLESSGVPGVLPQNTATNTALGGYQEPPKLSYSPGLPTDKGCPWRGSEGCAEPASFPLGCPYPPAPQRQRDALCHPKDSSELPLLLAPRNGQPKEPPPGWAEAVLAPLALYSHAYHRYPLPFPAADTQRPGKPRGDGDPPAFRSCPFLLSSLFPPPGPQTEPGFGGGGPEGPVGDGRFAGTEWRLGPYVPAWGAQPLYLGVPPRCKAAPGAFEGSCGLGSKDIYPKKEPGFHLQAEDPHGQPGHGGDGEGATGVPEPPGAPVEGWQSGGPPSSSSHPPAQHRSPPAPPAAQHGPGGGLGGRRAPRPPVQTQRRAPGVPKPQPRLTAGTGGRRPQGGQALPYRPPLPSGGGLWGAETL
nr:basic proline-rich protein-like [Anas platyrhynchos]